MFYRLEILERLLQKYMKNARRENKK